MIDYFCIETFGVPLRSPQTLYKGKHEDDIALEKVGKNPIVSMYRTPSMGKMSRPRVTSLETQYKNNWILITSIGITYGCYWTAWSTLFWDNDAGAFFVDCLTMWTQFVYFYKDEKSIQYSYV